MEGNIQNWRYLSDSRRVVTIANGNGVVGSWEFEPVWEQSLSECTHQDLKSEKKPATASCGEETGREGVMGKGKSKCEFSHGGEGRPSASRPERLLLPWESGERFLNPSINVSLPALPAPVPSSLSISLPASVENMQAEGPCAHRRRVPDWQAYLTGGENHSGLQTWHSN